MNAVRTILWVLILVGLILFSWANWNPGISVRIWSNLVVDTRLPAVVVISFLLGLLPMWLFHRGVTWRLSRRIRYLETAVQPAAVAHAPGETLRQSRDDASVARAEPHSDTLGSDDLRPQRPADLPTGEPRP